MKLKPIFAISCVALATTFSAFSDGISPAVAASLQGSFDFGGDNPGTAFFNLIADDPEFPGGGGTMGTVIGLPGTTEPQQVDEWFKIFAIADNFETGISQVSKFVDIIVDTTTISFSFEDDVFVGGQISTSSGVPIPISDARHTLEPVPEHTSILSLLALGILGTASTLKRKHA